MTSNESIIEISNTNVYQKNSIVLFNVNVKINRGEFVYIIGKNAAGKSSFLKLLYADIPLDDGEAKVAGFNLKNIKNKDIPLLRRQIGIVFQDFQLLMDRTVNENLLFVLKATGWKDNNKMMLRLQEVLEKVGLESKGLKMPHQLSGGEQQKVVIARSIINDPDIILADEPTGNLSPETSEIILKLLIDISKTGKVVLMATHDFSLYNKFPARTLKCEAGHITEADYVHLC